jgi:hypothetical protein
MSLHQQHAERNRRLALLCAFIPIPMVFAVAALDGVTEYVVLGLLIAVIVSCAALIGADLTRRHR